MSRTSFRLTAVAVLAAISVAGPAVAAPLATASGSHRASTGRQAVAAATATTVAVRSTRLGRILVNSRGFTVYAFSRDGRGEDRCVAISGCTAVWPPLTTHGSVRAGAGVQASLLGTISLGGGTRQVTYAGHPLYTYAADSGPGQTDYVGASQFGGVWPALQSSGRLVG